MIYLGTDHRGFELKEKIALWLGEWGYEFEDLGAASYDKKDDYPDFASAVARKVSENPKENRGILLCGSGVGVDVVANKFKSVRSALVWGDEEALVKQSRQHDGTNVLSLPADHLSEKQAKNIVKTWLETPDPSEERHLRRIKKISNLES
ncbi:RpiB/LacA/LacB family sugar-phosphate isomerase [Candidatus Saccharibacteria bacterium]|nr:RpiB/LacA/LacB family sugar-phosphate isomerase [Candidatus Saccharibacteria bacterium]